MKLENYDVLEEFFDNETVSKIESLSTKFLENQFSEVFEFDKLFWLGNGEYSFVIDKKTYLYDEKHFLQTLKSTQSIIKDAKIKVEEIDFNISVVISFAYEGEKRLESAKLGLKKILKENLDFIIADNLANIKQEQAQKNMKTVNMIINALQNSKIVSYFQPIIDNATQEILKYESLVRLIDENGKVLSPFFFLDTAKKSNYYDRITNIVLEHSFSILKHCQKDISINLSALDIEQPRTRNKVLELLKTNQKVAHRVVFELLEDENVKDFELVKNFITEVKSYGVKIAIDDFGAGYSNYERLLDYQPDILKIDGCLIRNIETSHYSVSVVKSIVMFAKEQNLQTVAEFIENESIFKIVKDLGVDFSQGYYFGKPGPLV
jgi:EAL domain-containing protein (putative c-di-GMP-specific phosphodiesterase class I)